jgi:hypothetical protein
VTAHTLANQDAFLKEVYTTERILEQSYGENPLFAFMAKEQGTMAGGRRYIQPVEFGNPGGASADFGDAMTDNFVSQYEDFFIPRKKQYQRIQVNHELLFATARKSDAYVSSMKEFDRGFKSLGEKIGRRLYRTQGGNIGQLAIASTNTTTLSFTDNAAVFNYQINQVLQFSTTDGTGTLLDGGDTTTVTAVDHEAGTVTVADNLGVKIAGITTSSFVFPRGDYNACLAGIEDWLPVDNRATKLAATFNGVPSRAIAPVYLGGIFYDGTAAGGLDEVIIKATGKAGKYGAKTSHILANPESLSDLELISNSKMRIIGELTTSLRSEDTGDVIVGFSGYKAIVGGRTVRIYPDRNCPSNRLTGLQLDTWTVWYTGELINWLGESYTGNRLQPSQNEDSAEARLASYQNVGCSAPGWNWNAKINPST